MLSPTNMNMGHPALKVAHVPVITSIYSLKRREPEPLPRSSKSACLTAPSTQLPSSAPGLRHTRSAIETVIQTPVVHRPRALSNGCDHKNLPEPPSAMVGAAQQRQLSPRSLSLSTGFEHKNLLKPPSLVVGAAHQLQVSPRSRASSSGAEFQSYQSLGRSCKRDPFQPMLSQKIQQHVYMNVPHPVASHVYVNLPLPASMAPHPGLTIKRYQTISYNQRFSNSKTPQPERVKELLKANTGIHSNYVEIRSEDQENLTPAQNMKSSKLYSKSPRRRASLPGYVEMSSPYIKTETEKKSESTSLGDIATKLAEYACHVPRNIFCPLCPRYFGDEKCLGSHLQTEHHKELNTLVFG
ncbi:unnamed protein product, partial [Meganyctiphanes norvegica]